MTGISAFQSALCDWTDAFMHRSMHGILLYARRNGLSMWQLRTLAHISRGPRGVHDIGDDLEITTSAASQMVERMVQQGLVTREEDPRDRRLRQLILTKKGEQVVEEGFRAGHAWVDTLALSLTPEELEQATAALSIMVARASIIEAPPGQ